MEKESRRGLADGSAEPRFLVIGRVIKPHGVRGEVRIDVHTDTPERFTYLEEVYIGRDDPIPVGIESVRFHKTWILLKLEGYEDRREAEALRNQWVQVPYEDALPLNEGEYFLFQIIGASVIGEDGVFLGTLTEILETKANNVFVVQGPLGEILIPDIEETILEVDVEDKVVTARLLPGLIA